MKVSPLYKVRQLIRIVVQTLDTLCTERLHLCIVENILQQIFRNINKDITDPWGIAFENSYKKHGFIVLLPIHLHFIYGKDFLTESRYQSSSTLLLIWQAPMSNVNFYARLVSLFYCFELRLWCFFKRSIKEFLR